MKYNVSFELLGSRDYIHSTSITHTLLKILETNSIIKTNEDIVMIDAVFKSKVYHNGSFVINTPVNGAKIVYNIKLGNKIEKVYYIENNVPVENRIPYDEDALVGDAVINKKDMVITMKFTNKEEVIFNTLVAASKKLALDLFGSKGYGSWSLGRYSIKWAETFKDIVGNEFSIHLVSNIDDCYTKNDLFIKGKYYGSLYAAMSRNS